MAVTGNKGIDVRQTANRIIARVLLQTSAGALVTSGTTNLSILELQTDGTFKTYDFSSNTFKASGMTSGQSVAAMTYRARIGTADAAVDTGLWTYVLSTLSGFTAGAIYFFIVNNSTASPTDQVREFQFGDAQGDLQVDSSGYFKGSTGTGTGQFSLASGVVDANTVKVNGTSQTARDLGASVLLSSGTGTGQLDITSGVVKANWVQILGSAITGTASQLAAAVTKFFNVATPTGTVNSLPDAVPGASGGVVIAGSNAATTFATLTVTGAFSINSVSNVAQTGDSFARLGAPTGASIAADIQTRLATSGYTVPPTVIQIRTEMDNNSTKLAHLDADITSRLAPTTAGRTLDVSAGGEAGLDWANIGSPTTTVNLSGTTIAVVSGSVGSITGITFPTNFSVLSISATTGLVTFANTTIGVSGDFSATMKTSLNAATPSVTVSDKTGFSLSATQTFSNTGTWTGNVSGNVTGSVNSVTTGVTLAASAVQAIWDALTSALTTTGSIGKSLVTFLGNFANMISGTGTGTPKFTTSALSNAPTGGGGGSGLSGPSSVTLTFVDASTNPVPLVEFTLLSQDKSTAIGSARADSNGVATFGTDDGSYYVTAQATSTVLFADAALSVSSTTAQTITGSSNIPAPSTVPSGCNVYDTAIGIDGAAKAGVEYHFRVTQAASGTRNGSEQTATSVGTGTNNIVMALTQGDTVAIKRGTAAQWETFTVPASTSAQLSDLLDEEAAVGKDGSTP